MNKFLIFIFIAGLIFPLSAFAEVNGSLGVTPSELIVLTNKKRSADNIAPLIENKLLSKAAQLKAEHMASQGYFSHTSPDGKLPSYFMDKVGYRYSQAGASHIGLVESRH